MSRPARRLLATVVTGVLLAGCGLPLASGVQQAGEVPAEQRLPEPISVLPPGPQPDAAPEQVVLGFLAAQGSSRDDHGIARSFLAPSVRGAWQDDVGVTVYDPRTAAAGRPSPDGDGVVVTVSLDVVGEIGPDGAARAQPPEARSQRYRLRAEAGRWQLVGVPDGLTLSPAGRERSYDAVPVHFLAPLSPPDGRHLVADLVHVPAGGGRVDAVVDRLLAGPSSGLAGSAVTAVPPGARRRAPVGVSAGGEVTVDLAGPLDLPDRARADLSAQLVWTLRAALPEFTRLRLLLDGAELRVPGVTGPQPRSAWAGYAPEGQVEQPEALALVGGQLRALTPVEQDREPVQPSDLASVVDLAVDARRGRVATLTAEGEVRTLRTGQLGEPSAPAVQDPGLRSPSWGSGALGVFVLRTGARPAVLLVRPGLVADVLELPADTLPALDGASLLRVSRDGTRVALVAGGVLQVGRLEPAGPAPRLVALRRLATGVLDVAWRSGTTLDVLVEDDVPPLLPLLRLSVDGTSSQDTGLVGLAEGDPVALAAYGELPLLVETRAGGRSTVFSGDGGAGFQVALPDATRPAYPR